MELTSQKMRRLAPELDPLRLGTGWTPDELSKPQIIVESTFGDSHPGSGHLDKLVNAACKGAAEAGGHGARYFATDMCDGMAQGHDGINYSLAHREAITNLVENAIKYSFRGCKGEHRLTIEAAKAEEQLHLIIVNNGQCIEKVRLKELNEGTKIKNHLGISNVRKRLELYYGEDTAVYFENILSGGVKVHLFIPIQGGNDDADSSH